MRCGPVGGTTKGMSARLAQVCLFSAEGGPLRRFLEVISGQLEHDDGQLLSFHMGAGPATVAWHAPAGELGEGDLVVTLSVPRPADVDRLHRALLDAGLSLDDAPESTEWGWRLFWYRAAPHLVFEVGAPLG